MLLFAVAKVETLAVGGTAAGFTTFLMEPFSSLTNWMM